MILSKETFQLLLELGAPAEKVAEFLHSLDRDLATFTPPLSDYQRMVEARRECDRERKRRAREACPRISEDVRGQSADSEERVSPKEIPPRPPKEITPSQITPLEKSNDFSPPAVTWLAKLGGFAQFWEAYPSKTGKRAAETAYDRAVRRIGGPDPPSVIMAGLGRAKISRKWRDGFVKNPATWLNQDCWEDEPEEISPNGKPSDKLAAKDANLARAFAGAQSAAARRDEFS